MSGDAQDDQPQADGGHAVLYAEQRFSGDRQVVGGGVETESFQDACGCPGAGEPVAGQGTGLEAAVEVFQETGEVRQPCQDVAGVLSRAARGVGVGG